MKGGGEPNHSVAVKAPTAMTPHQGSLVSGPLTVADAVAGEGPEADVWIYPTVQTTRANGNAVRTNMRLGWGTVVPRKSCHTAV